MIHVQKYGPVSVSSQAVLNKLQLTRQKTRAKNNCATFNKKGFATPRLYAGLPTSLATSITLVLRVSSPLGAPLLFGAHGPLLHNGKQ